MEICEKWLPIFILLILRIALVVCYYPDYYVEDSCKIGDETIIYDTTKVGSFATLSATSHPPYKSNKTCKIVIKPPANQGIVLSVRKIDFRTGSSYNDCRDYVEVYHSSVFSTVLCSFKYDLEEKLSYFSKGPMTIKYHTELKEDLKNDIEIGFVFTYTSVYLDIQDCNHDNIFMCGNGRCISNDLTCDGRNNCGDRTDESRILCDDDSQYFLRMSNRMYVYTFAILIFLIVVSGSFIFRYRRRRNADTESLTEQEEPTARLAPYQAIHPTGFFICQNPAGPKTLLPNHSKILESEGGGFSNPCYPTGIPLSPPPYSQ